MAKIPTLEYLRSGILLTGDESDIARREISGLETIVELEEKEISRLQEQLEQNKRTLSCYRALFAPVRLLPPEVLGEIFMYFKQSSKSSGPSEDVSPDLYQVMCLSLVCNTWRRVLLNIPEFWTSISIPKWPNAQVASLLQLQLTRSSSLPLRLSMSTHCKEIPDILRPSLPRFERLEIALPQHFPLLSGPNTLDSLKEIRIRFNSTHSEESLPLMTIVAQKLESVALLSHQCRWRHGCMGLPWIQLTGLEFRGRWFNQDILGILDECNNLLELTTHLRIASARSYGTMGDFVPSHPVILPLLCTWKITRSTGQIFTDLALDTLVLPSLRTLHFESPPPSPKLVSLVERSSCPLECLQITVNDSSQMSETAQVQLVESLPSLRTFLHIIKDDYYGVELTRVSSLVKRLLTARRLRHEGLC